MKSSVLFLVWEAVVVSRIKGERTIQKRQIRCSAELDLEYCMHCLYLYPCQGKTRTAGLNADLLLWYRKVVMEICFLSGEVCVVEECGAPCSHLSSTRPGTSRPDALGENLLGRGTLWKGQGRVLHSFLLHFGCQQMGWHTFFPDEQNRAMFKHLMIWSLFFSDFVVFHAPKIVSSCTKGKKNLPRNKKLRGRPDGKYD